jgi:O-antigen ligase
MPETISATWWQSKLARRLDVLAVVAGIVLVFRVALEEDLSSVSWAFVGAAVLLITLTRWPYGALLVLIVMSAMPRFFVEVVGWKARPEHFAVVIVSLAVGVWLLRYKRKIRLERMDYWVLALVALNYASSAFTSLQPSSTLRWALMNNLAVIPYFLIRALVPDRQTLVKGFRMMMGVGFAEALYGILCYLSLHAFGTSTGMGVGFYLADVAVPYGSLYEPNLFGAYTACTAVLFLAVYMIEEHRRIGWLICFMLASVAAALSFSRAALIGLVIGSVWVFWMARKNKAADRHKLSSLLPLTALILVMGIMLVGGVLQKRFSSLYNEGLEEETALTRYVVIYEALADFPSHPLLGSGTASLQLSFDWSEYLPDWSSEKAWVPNVFVRILHDTGLLGLTAFLGFMVSLWLRIRRCLRGWNGQTPLLVGLAAGALVYCVSFQFTDGTILAFSWIHLGFLATAAILLDDSGHGSMNNNRISYVPPEGGQGS